MNTLEKSKTPTTTNFQLEKHKAEDQEKELVSL